MPVELANHDGSEPLLDTPTDDVVGNPIEQTTFPVRFPENESRKPHDFGVIPPTSWSFPEGSERGLQSLLLVVQNRTSVIEDARVLQDDFIPVEVEYRNQELNRLSEALAPCLEGEPPEDIVIFGPTGTGKTCIAKYTLDQLREEAPGVATQYINCWQDYNKYRTVQRLMEGLGKGEMIESRWTAKDELIVRLREELDGPYVVILDEVDQHQETDILYDLYTLPEITMILIANRETELFYQLDDRVESRLRGSPRLHLQKYSTDELVSILETRVKWALAPDTVERPELEFMAEHAAGDARVAISILRSAANHAQREDAERITEDLIEEAIPGAREELRQQTLEKLDGHQLRLYDIIEEAGEIQPGELYEIYVGEVEDPMTQRTVRNYLNKMEHYRLITSSGRSRAKVYRPATE